MIRKTCRRINEPGHAHSITFSCFQRRAFLSKDRSRQWFVEALDQARRKHEFDLWAWVIMPEHVHLLICPRAAVYSISRILTALKQPVSRRALVHVRKKAPSFLTQMEDRQPSGKTAYRFWQRGGGYDRNLTDPNEIEAVVDYLHANPVRRGLCSRPTDWVWSSAREYQEPGSGVLRIDRGSMPRIVE